MEIRIKCDLREIRICSMLLSLFGQIAQLVEQRTENPCVAGSIPVLATLLLSKVSMT